MPLRPVGALVAVALWNGPLAVGVWVGGQGFGRGAMVGGLLLAGWLLAAWFSADWRARFFDPVGSAGLTDERVLASAAAVFGSGLLAAALL